MKRTAFFIVALFLTLGFSLPAYAYLSDEWTKDCGTLSFREGFFFLSSLRLYSRENWEDALPFIGKRVCVEGFAEKREGKTIGISYHSLSLEVPSPIVNEPAPLPVVREEPVPAPILKREDKRFMYYGFLVPGSRNNVLLLLENGSKVLLLKSSWRENFSGSKFFIEGTPIVRDSVIRSIKNPSVYSLEDFALAHPPTVNESGRVLNDLDYTEMLNDGIPVTSPGVSP